jgi:hypothetical protein
VGVAGDLLIDFKCERECCATGSAGDAWLRTITHRRKKVFELQPKRFSTRWIELFER